MQAVIGYPALSQRIPGSSVRTLRRMVAEGAIPFRRLSGKLVVFDCDAVQKALLSDRADGQTPAPRG
jgi:hypothetical protein